MKYGILGAQTNPHLNQFYHDKMISSKEVDQMAVKSDAVFACLPQGQARQSGDGDSVGARLIDMGADYRFSDIMVYVKWYKPKHVQTDSKAVYGLTELKRDQFRAAHISIMRGIGSC